MTNKQRARKLRIAILGCGPIAQFAHFDACRKAHNAELYGICDVSEELATRMAAVHQPQVVYPSFDAMLSDPEVDAVIVATADQFHVELCRQAIDAGKHVLVEKPLGVNIEECEALAARVDASGLVLQVGNNRRFDPGIAFARDFVQTEIGELMALKAWYNDSVHRYTMTDNLQPIPIGSSTARRPDGDPKADRRRYYMLTHGSHLVDTARFLGGDIVAVQARLVEKFGAYCWFGALEFTNGAVGHVDLTVAVRGDFEEGFRIYGEFGSVNGRVHLPWFHKASDVECFSIKDDLYRRPLGQDAHTYKRQIEGFAETILFGSEQAGATVHDGAAAMRALVALARSAESGERRLLADVTGAV